MGAGLLGLAAPLAPLAASPAVCAPHRASTMRAPSPDTAAGGLVVGVGRSGLGFGDVPVLHGIRFDTRDRALRRVDGINVTLWAPASDPGGTVNGLALGPVGPGLARLRGIGVGIAGAVAEREVFGLLVGGLGAVSEGDVWGGAVAGLGSVVQGDLRGLGAAGLGTVVQGSMAGGAIGGLGAVVQGRTDGLLLAGLGSVTQGSMAGVSLGGLAAVTEGPLRGISAGGLASVTDGRLYGMGAAGLAVVTGGGLDGAAVAGGAVVTGGRLRGVGLAGIGVQGRALRGFAAALGRNRFESARGLSVAAWNRVSGPMYGVSIGLYNDADELHGVQIGVLNRARDNPPPFEFLPFLNLHF